MDGVTDRGLDLAGVKTYRPRRAPLYGRSAVLLVVGAFGAATEPRALVLWAVVVLLGVAVTAGAWCGMPCLTAGYGGVRLRFVLGTRRAAWESIGPFSLISTDVGGLRRRRCYAGADVTGTAVGRNVRRRRKFVIPDCFVSPIAELVAELNAKRAFFLGISPPAVVGAPTAEPENPFGLHGFRAPWLTFALVGVLVAVFALESILAIGPLGRFFRPGVPTLLGLGGLNRTLVLSGDWYRLFTGPLLHIDAAHLVCNALALILAGYQLERLLGRLWFFAIFAVGGLGGALASLALNPATLTSVGASGAIMGLFAAAFVGSFRLRPGTLGRQAMQLRSFAMLVPSLLPLAAAAGAGRVDYAAHLGGALFGALAMLFLLKTWPDTARMPQRRAIAAVVAAVVLVSLAGSMVAVGFDYPKYSRYTGLIPQRELPHNQNEGKRRGWDLVARYPHDPRGHLYFGIALYEARDYRGAEREFGLALHQAQDLLGLFGMPLTNRLHGALAAALLSEGRSAQARAAAKTLCEGDDGDPYSEYLKKFARDRGLCG